MATSLMGRNHAKTTDDEGVGSGSDRDAVDPSTLSAKQRAEVERKKRVAMKRKQKKKKGKKGAQRTDDSDQEDEVEADEGVGDDGEVKIEYVTETPEELLKDPAYQQFNRVFDAFQINESGDGEAKPKYSSWHDDKDTERKPAESGTKAAIIEQFLKDEEDRKKEKDENDLKKLSKKKLKQKIRPSIAELKASCIRPDVVEWHDVTARDPKLLVYLKSLRNTVPVPRHWCFKRKYLVGKRGIERPPFDLPDFIKRTGIMEMRAALQEKEEHQSLKNKMREKARPKVGRIDIDYQKLHDAFFRWQTKPKMSIHGDLYYEGKEFETQMREKKPGELSDDLRIALGMPIGPNASKFPPPWLIAMQRYGPPPSYTNLKIPGLNGPIPDGCAFGYHAGGWGKPPVDEYGKPLYGDVFGIEIPAQPHIDTDTVQRSHWGEMEEEEEASEASSEADDNENETVVGDGDDLSGMQTPGAEGLMTPSGISSGLPTGAETPDSIELRKRNKTVDDGGDTPGPLYRVLAEKKIDRIGGQMMASTHIYDVTQTTDKKVKAPTASGSSEGVDIALTADELSDLSEEGLKQRYEAALRKERGEGADADFSDLVAEHAARQKRKRKPDDKKSSGPQKKSKDFKF